MVKLKRINKYISDSGLCSRREADKLVSAGRVDLNGETVTTGTKVSVGDKVHIDGKLIEVPAERIYLAFNKPTGVTCTTDLKDPDNIIDYINYNERIFPIGRLDKMSEGLIFLTNDGDLPSVLKLAYFHGGKKVTKKSLIRALREYTPSGLMKYNISQGINIGLKDLFLEEDLRFELEKIVSLVQNSEQLKESNASRSKFLIFEGPAGVGKTHAAMALAGELGIPLMKLGLNVANPYARSSIFKDVGRFGSSIFLIDDADKVFGGRAMDLDDGDALTADINKHLDELEERGAILIMSANDSKRFGPALRDRFKIVNFDYPSRKQILGYFGNLKLKSKIKMHLSDNDLFELNQKKNFRQLQRFWNECILHAVQSNKDKITKEDIRIIFGESKNKLNKTSMFG
jgi:16S rRNA U516 pseudouridylate synthase RsuA-like enzyme